MADIRTFSAHDKLAQAVADLTTDLARRAARDRRRFVVGLSGGPALDMVYRLLADERYSSRLPWAETHAFWTEERWIEPTDATSRQYSIKETLLDRVPIPQGQARPILTKGVSAEQAAEVADRYVREMFDGPPRPDLVLLGLGEDGSTAALFPGSGALLETEALFVPNSYVNSDDVWITSTPALLNAARNVIIVATGAMKAEAVHGALYPRHDDAALPAALIRTDNGNVTWALDAEAATLLPHGSIDSN